MVGVYIAQQLVKGFPEAKCSKRNTPQLALTSQDATYHTNQLSSIHVSALVQAITPFELTERDVLPKKKKKKAEAPLVKEETGSEEDNSDLFALAFVSCSQWGKIQIGLPPISCIIRQSNHIVECLMHRNLLSMSSFRLEMENLIAVYHAQRLVDVKHQLEMKNLIFRPLFDIKLWARNGVSHPQRPVDIELRARDGESHTETSLQCQALGSRWSASSTETSSQ
ncbi:hypothetical protein JRQ81_014657 [Phrynocephalus forsythii]|uniref:Uncharacterized protein n=1 Tax=Phrynocephalus forsythii TaxID=171643 RepID=A0A9Q1B314_9SAUR|nr:hypothetical protein JRQ81_014657 [Phrynocephalus forsythii]